MILVITMTESLSQIWSWIDARARSYADGVESRKKPSPEIDDFKKKKKNLLPKNSLMYFISGNWSIQNCYQEKFAFV